MRHTSRRAVLAGIASTLAVPHVLAQSGPFPNRPIRILIGYPAGGPLDSTTRIIAQDMSTDLGQQVVVENRPGASGQIATDAVARAPADGYLLMSTASTFIVNPLLMAKVNSDPIKDFAPVSHTAVLPTVLVTPPDSKAASVKDIVALAKAQPGTMTYASAGNGGPAHLAGAYLASQTGTQMTHVPMKGAGPALLEVMSGRVGFTFYTMTGLKQHVQEGKVKPLAITAHRRHPDFPNVPTMTEAGFPGFEDVGAWFGIVAPAGTPPAVVARLNQSIEKSLARPETREKMAGMGVLPVGGPPEVFKGFLEKDLARWSALIKAAGIKGE
ncbi:MAG TPA: tripartite tricarboxylate transporter substrate binding protein [Ramlibacter sp.]|nr:tripartite tricarboxylate transporter substrate binding protein [Ramlibacter sp.]